jgi:uncharacterized phiE125 gp8 family phage protein
MTLAEAKEFIRANPDTSQDETIKVYIKAAQSHLMQILNRSFTVTEWELTLDAFPTEPIRLDVCPVRGVTSIKYFDEDGVEQTLDPSTYYVDTVSEPGWVLREVDQEWPVTLAAANAVKVRFTAGYEPVEGGSGSDGDDELGNVPPEIKLAARVLVSHWNEYREPVISGTIVADVPMSVKDMVQPYRVFL